MTHNIIHDEALIADIIYNINKSTGCDQEIRGAMKQYAEHTLVKFIDSEVERLNGYVGIHDVDVKREYLQSLNPTITEQLVRKDVKELQDSEDNLQSLKAQLTKSK